MADAFQPIEKKITCPRCGAENDHTHAFCTTCGAPLSPEAAEAAQDPLATGLAAWDLMPPQVVVRRKARHL